ncbi:MAG: cytochrome c biogenesis protein ResB [Coriobacteriia bacterium]|nr:cytochrome c biogenesis protein ResB [Coriobacteriia bacterium]
MRRLLDSLTSRRASLLLMAFVAVTGAVGAYVPQRANVSVAQFEAWRADNPLLADAVALLGFDRVFSTWWFSAVLVVFLFALSVATWRMAVAASRRFRGGVRAPVDAVEGTTFDEVATRARAEGFRELRLGGELSVWRRHGVGIWAPTVMHAGMVVALLAAIAISAFSSSAVMDLSAGEVFEPGSEFLLVWPALTGSTPDFGTAFRLDDVLVETWPTGDLKVLTILMSLMDESGTWTEYESSANAPLRVRGHTIYVQSGEFGDAAFLVVTDATGVTHPLRMEFTFVREGETGYSDVAIGGEPVIDGRWDPYGLRGEKVLALRPAGDETTVPVLLAEGESAQVGELHVEFVARGEWARLIVTRSSGIAILFGGFAIIGLGAMMIYLFVPRELVLARTSEGLRYSWWAPRMGRSYLPELDRILGRSDETER